MDQSRNFGRAGSMYDHGRAVSTVRTPVGQLFSAERRPYACLDESPSAAGLWGALNRHVASGVAQAEHWSAGWHPSQSSKEKTYGTQAP